MARRTYVRRPNRRRHMVRRGPGPHFRASDLKKRSHRGGRTFTNYRDANRFNKRMQGLGYKSVGFQTDPRTGKKDKIHVHYWRK